MLAEVGVSKGDKSAFGILDLAGNVPEWVDGEYHPTDGRPELAGKSVRGGGYFLPRKFARAGLRMSLPEQPGKKALGPLRVGFRCACDTTASVVTKGKDSNSP